MMPRNPAGYKIMVKASCSYHSLIKAEHAKIKELSSPTIISASFSHVHELVERLLLSVALLVADKHGQLLGFGGNMLLKPNSVPVTYE